MVRKALAVPVKKLTFAETGSRNTDRDGVLPIRIIHKKAITPMKINKRHIIALALLFSSPAFSLPADYGRKEKPDDYMKLSLKKGEKAVIVFKF